MNRTMTILLALLTLVPTFVPAVAAQVDPGDPPAPPEEPPEAPEVPEPGAQNLGTYLDEDFDDLHGWFATRLRGDRQEGPLWHVEPLGRNGSMAATLSDPEGLPRGLHQALVSPEVDLTPVPSQGDQGTADRAADLATGTVDRVVRGAAATAVASASGLEDAAEPVTEQQTTTTGTVDLPRGPAHLTVVHRFHFDDSRNEEDQAVSGFVIEARSPGGEWVPLEAVATARAARGTDAPGPRNTANEVVENTELTQSVDPCIGHETTEEVILSIFPFFEGFTDSFLSCDQDQVLVTGAPAPGQALLDVGDSVSLEAVSSTADSPVPGLPNAYVQPLESRGYTGASPDEDGDGTPDPVGHIFDLSPYAGERAELRFRAGTSPVSGVPGGFWAIDRAQVQAGARSADLRLTLQAPVEGHLAPTGEAFPLTAQVQNVGLATQPGPFQVNVTVTRGGTQTTETIEVPGPLGFLDSAPAVLPFEPVKGAPYGVEARVMPGNPDTEPRNDVDAGLLPVGRDASIDLQVLPNETVVEDGDLVQVTVLASPRGNVPVNETLSVVAYPYDPETNSPVNRGAQPFGQEQVLVPRSADRHPAGVEDVRVSTTFSRTLDSGAYVLLAQLGDVTARAYVGVDTPPPPLFVDPFEDVGPGPTSFELETPAGTWQVHGRGDLVPVPVDVSAGSAATGGAWVPLTYDAMALRPYNQQALADVTVPTRGVLSSDAPGGDTLDQLLGFCFIVGLGCEYPIVGTPGETIQSQVDSTRDSVADTLPPVAAVYLESPKGTQRVYGLQTDVNLTQSSRATLRYASSLLVPPESAGLTEVRVYVQTKQDLSTLSEQLSNPENCPREAPCQVINTASGPLRVAEQLGNVVFNLERTIRCQVLADPIGAGVGTTALCPSNATGAGGEGTCETPAGIGPRYCIPDERSRVEVLTALLSGTLVDQETDAYPWQWREIDLSPWAGRNVTVTFIALADTEATTQHLETTGVSNDIVERVTVGYGAPSRPRGVFLVDRVTVETDNGIRLSPDNITRSAGSAPGNTVQDQRPGVAQRGWRTLGYAYAKGLGQETNPLRSNAQFLLGDGRPGGVGADKSEALQLGVVKDQDRGVKLYRGDYSAPEGYSGGSDGHPPDLYHQPRNDPAVTVVASPTMDLRGAKEPVLRFSQRYDLHVVDPQERDQPNLASLDAETLSAALGLSAQQVAGCGIQGDGPFTLVQMACALEVRRDRDPGFNVQDEVFLEAVAQPMVSAGLYLQARTLTEDGWSEPLPLQPDRGYRFPAGDEGAFEPTLNYTVRTPDSFPGYITSRSGNSQGAGAFDNQAVFTDPARPSLVGQPVWAGHSDVDGDGTADWAPSTVDLSSFAGEQVRIEFVLVARNELTKEELTALPWQIDDVSVTEGSVEGDVSLHELRWPNSDLPLLALGEDLPVRLTATTTTGLSQPVHARATLVDAQGCFRGTVTGQAEYRDAAGRAQPMPPGALLELPEMVIPGQNVTGTSPWSLHVALDTGRTPPQRLGGSVTATPIAGPVERHDLTGAIDVRPDLPDTGIQEDDYERTLELDLVASDPGCEPSPVITMVLPGSGSGVPTVQTDAYGQARQVELDIIVRKDGDDASATLVGPTSQEFTQGQLLLGVSQGADATGAAHTLLLHDQRGDDTVEVQPHEDRVPVASPFQVDLRPASDLSEATLWAVALPGPNETETDPTPVRLWDGTLSAAQTRTVSVDLSDVGPHLLALTGLTAQGERTVLGGGHVVVIDATGAGDPVQLDNIAQLTAGAGERSDLRVRSVTVDPPSGLSTEPRRVVAEVQNAGNTKLEGLKVSFSANGQPFATQTRQSLLPGAIERFTIAEFEPGGDPSIVVRVEAETQEHRAVGAAPLRSLVDLQALTPRLGSESDGWQVQGQRAIFQDPQSGTAPRDTVGSLNLTGAKLAGLADVAVTLDHDLDMEEAFDGGQVVLSRDQRTEVLQAGPAMKEMGPYSPVQGDALTGQRRATDDPVALDAKRFLGGQLERLMEQTGYEALGEQLLEEEQTADLTCGSRAFSDSPALIPEDAKPRCEWARPLVPVPSTAMRQGVWHFQPGAMLSDTETWEVTMDTGSTHQLEVETLTQHLLLEADEALVQAAQQQDRLTVRFDEARMLQTTARSDIDTITVEACLRFVDLEEVPESDGGMNLDAQHPSQRVCSGLTHEQAQAKNLDWGETVLLFGDIPDGEFDLVRLELSMRMHREPLLSDVVDSANSGDRNRLRNPFLGWFVGPVEASAGQTEVRWVPEPDELDQTDPFTGRDAGTDVDKLLRYEEVVPQSGYLSIDEVLVDGRSHEITNVQDPTTPQLLLFLGPCQWWRSAASCGYAESFATNYDPILNLSDDWRRSLITVPYALGTSCFLPAKVASVDALVEDGTDKVNREPLACDPQFDTGTGVQVLSDATLSQGTIGCGDEDSEATVGSPMLWRTRCLHAARVDSESKRTETGGDGIALASNDLLAAEKPSLAARGYSLDYRLIIPVDLRFAAHEAWAVPDLQIPHAGDGNRRAIIDVTAEARIQGERQWTPLPFCSAGGTCYPSWAEDRPRINLSGFIGQRAEVAIRVEMPHPTLLYDDKSEPEGMVQLDGFDLEAGYVRMIGLDLGLRAWTDTSLEGSGWTVDRARLFGLPVDANVGIQGFETPLLVEDQLHVHTDPADANDDLYLRVPATADVYNQGNEPMELELEGAIAMDHAKLDQDVYLSRWCEVRVEPSTISLGPGTTTRWEGEVRFIPVDEVPDVADLPPGFKDIQDGSEEVDAADCFPGQAGLDEDEEASWNYRLKLNLTGGPENDYVGSDDRVELDLRANPFIDHGHDEDLHAPELRLEDLRVEPSRPNPGDDVRITATFAMRDATDQDVDIRLDLVEPLPASAEDPGRVLRTLREGDADVPVSGLPAYGNRTIQWTLDDYPRNATLVLLNASIDPTHGDGREYVEASTWFAGASLDGTQKTMAYATDFGCGGDLESDGDVSIQGQRGTDGDFHCYPTASTTGGGIEAVIGTDFLRYQENPPPVVGVRARWQFAGADDPRQTDPSEPGFSYAKSGWAIQVCTVTDRPDDDDCPLDIGADHAVQTSGQNDWEWRTLRVQGTPTGTLGTLTSDPSVKPTADPDCNSGLNQQREVPPDQCTTALDSWAGMEGGDPLVMGTSPGLAFPTSDPQGWNTVLASGTDCTHAPSEADKDKATRACPLPWGQEARTHFVRYRVIAFSTQEPNTPKFLQVSHMTLSPVGLSVRPEKSTGGFAIPEAATKAVPLNFTVLGDLGARIDPSIQAPSGWDVSFEGLSPGDAIERGTRSRLLVEAPISPSGVSQSALITPCLALSEASLRNACPLVPVGVEAGLHPDLVVERVNVPDEIIMGEELLVEARVANQGISTSAPAQVVGAVRYSDGRVDLLTQLEEGSTLPALAPGASAGVILKWVPSKVGPAEVRMAADLSDEGPITGPLVSPWGRGDVPELKECSQALCNNVGKRPLEVAPPPLADLSVSAAVEGQLPLNTGEPVDVTITVTNNGPSPVPVFKVRLLAGVISLLDEDPLVVNEPLAVGERWTETVELIPGTTGNLSLVATAFSDERLVQEDRSLRLDGTVADSDNVLSLEVPVIATGLDVQVAGAVDARGIVANRTLEVPVRLENRGTVPLVASVAARGPSAVGTLVDDTGAPGGTLRIDPGRSSDGRLRVFYDDLPQAGRHEVQLEVASEAGLERRTIVAEVPQVVDVGADPVSVKVDTGRVDVPVVLRSLGNAPVTAHVTIDVPGLSRATRSVQVAPGADTNLTIPTWVEAPIDGVAKGRLLVRAGEVERVAPLHVVQERGSLPTVLDASVQGGNRPAAQVSLANLGDETTELNVSLVQGNETLAHQRSTVTPGQRANLTLSAMPKPGEAHLLVQDTITGREVLRRVPVSEVRPDLHTLRVRHEPLAPTAGEPVRVMASIANDGGSPVTVRPGLFVDGVLYTTTAEEHTIEPGSVAHVLFEWEATEGAHTLAVNADPLDRVEDRSGADDARASEVSVQSEGVTGEVLNRVPVPPLGLLIGVLALLARVRRDRTE